MPQTDFSQFPSMGNYTVGRQDDIILCFSKSDYLPTILAIIFKYKDNEVTIPVFKIDYSELQQLTEETKISVAHHGMNNFNVRKRIDDNNDLCYNIYYGDLRLFSYKRYFNDSEEAQIQIFTPNKDSNEDKHAAFIILDDEYDNSIWFSKLNQKDHHIPNSTLYRVV